MRPPIGRLLKIAAGFAILAIAVIVFKNYAGRTDSLQVFAAPADATLEHKLPDGSLAELNRASELVYSPDFTGKERRVKLSGEAFFEVQRDEKRPFIIEAGEAKVTVLARRADHPIRLEAAFEYLLVAFGVWANLGKCFYPIDAQSFLELRLFFLCEDSYFLAIFKGPKGTADEVIFVRIGTLYLIFYGTDERSDQGSHGVSPNPVAATHLGHSFLLTDRVDAFRISDDVGHLSHRDLILI